MDPWASTSQGRRFGTWRPTSVSAPIVLGAILLVLVASVTLVESLTTKRLLADHWLEVTALVAFGSVAVALAWQSQRHLEALLSSEARYRLLAENSSDFVSMSDEEAVVTWISPTVTSATGWPTESLLGHSLMDFIHPGDKEVLRDSFGPHAEDEVVHTRVRFRLPDGTFRWLARSARDIVADDGSVRRRVSGWRDIDDVVTAERAVMASEARYRLIAEHSSDIVLSWDRNGRIDWVSPSFSSILGWPAHEVIGRTPASLVHPDDLVSMPASQRDAYARGARDGRGEARYATADGNWRWMTRAGKPLVSDRGEPLGGVLALHDFESEHQALELLRFQATHDGLTELTNRHEFLARLTTMLGSNRRSEDRMAVMFIDIDGLKDLNDTYGHGAGDKAIVHVAQQIAGQVRAGDLAARLGGDEFVAALRDLREVSDAESVALAILDSITEPLTLEEEGVTLTLSLSLSIGLTVAKPGEDPDTVLRRADRALYRAKREGGAQLITYDAAHDDGLPSVDVRDIERRARARHVT